MILVSGCAGFIGSHVVRALLARGDSVIGVDNLNDYYDVRLKIARLSQFFKDKHFAFYCGDIADKKFLDGVFSNGRISKVLNLAAQAGVRYSLVNPGAYVQSNLVGFANILEACRHHDVQHLVYASSSSVYGANAKLPFSTEDRVERPVSLYAATKKANELMAHTYSHLFGLPTTGLRYFTVYGPWGRPDMSPWLFTEAIIGGRAIKVFNYGRMRRDFTYIDDISEGTIRVLDKVPDPKDGEAPYRVFNIGNNEPVDLMAYIQMLEDAIGIKAKLELEPLQPGDVIETFAEISDLEREIGFRPRTSLEEGIPKWVAWYRSYTG